MRGGEPGSNHRQGQGRDLLRGWQAAHQAQNRDGSSAVAALAYAKLDLGDALPRDREEGERP